MRTNDKLAAILGADTFEFEATVGLGSSTVKVHTMKQSRVSELHQGIASWIILKKALLTNCVFWDANC
jgi:hypothetical protein